MSILRAINSYYDRPLSQQDINLNHQPDGDFLLLVVVDH